MYEKKTFKKYILDYNYLTQYFINDKQVMKVNKKKYKT